MYSEKGEYLDGSRTCVVSTKKREMYGTVPHYVSAAAPTPMLLLVAVYIIV